MASAEQQLIERGFEKGIAEGIEKGIAEGIEKGIAEGIEKGIAEGLKRSLTSLLRARFGDLGPPTEVRLALATTEDLDRWTERVLVAQHIEDVFDER
jgi:predicted transposase YdaD